MTQGLLLCMDWVDHQASLAERRVWEASASCLGVGDWIFFGARDYSEIDGNSTRREPGRKKRLDIAKDYCADCLVLEECREWSITNLPHGYAGGMTERERQRERRKRSAERRRRASE